jgi:hypothetical protein
MENNKTIQEEILKTKYPPYKTIIERQTLGIFNDVVRYKFKITTNKKPSKVSGHKFLAIIDKNPYVTNPLQLHCEFLKLTFVEDNDIMDTGKYFEPLIIKSVFGDRMVKTYPYEEIRDAFPYDDIFGGLPDGYVYDSKLVIEIKTANKIF